MSAVRSFFHNLASLWSLVVGLGITFRYFFYPTKTVHYPRKTVKVEDLTTYRGHIELVPKPKDPTKPKCITCMMCMAACPSGCYTVLKTKPPKPTPEQLEAEKAAKEAGKEIPKPKPIKEPSRFLYDYTLCSLCGICVDACPVKSLRFSNDVYVASADKKDFKYDLLAELQKNVLASQE